MEYTEKSETLLGMEVVIDVELHEVEADSKYRVSFKRKNGSEMVFREVFDAISAEMEAKPKQLENK